MDGVFVLPACESESHSSVASIIAPMAPTP
jgi:hypothetical protein